MGGGGVVICLQHTEGGLWLGRSRTLLQGLCDRCLLPLWPLISYIKACHSRVAPTYHSPTILGSQAFILRSQPSYKEGRHYLPSGRKESCLPACLPVRPLPVCVLTNSERRTNVSSWWLLLLPPLSQRPCEAKRSARSLPRLSTLIPSTPALQGLPACLPHHACCSPPL